MAELELVGFESSSDELKAPQGADSYVAKKAINFEQPVTTGSTIAGRDVAADGTKLDLVSVTQAVDLDTIEARVNALDTATVLKGLWDASIGTFPVSTVAGETWIISVAATVDAIVFNVGDRILAIVNGASTTTFIANWLKLDYTDQVMSVNGKVGAVVLVKGDIADLVDTLLDEDLDSLAKLNALVLDATLGDAADFASAAQGILAASALQSDTPGLVNTGITAYATGGQANAVELVMHLNVITVCATAGDSSKLPTAVAGWEVEAVNRGAEAMDLFPNTADEIGEYGANNAISIAPKGSIRLKAIDDTTWVQI